MSTQTINDLGPVILGSEVIVVFQDQVLLMQRSMTSKLFPGFWVPPGGHIDATDDFLTAAIREVQEETGVTITANQIKLKVLEIHYHVDRKETFTMPIFLAKLTDHQPAISSEEGNTKWFPISEALTMDNVFPPCKYYFDHVLNDKPGILYTNIHWDKLQIVQVHNHRLDRDY